MRIVHALAIAAIMLGAAASISIQIGAQTGNPSGLPSGGQSQRVPFGSQPRDSQNGDALGPGRQEELEKGRQSERQKKLIADTDRLLALANELKLDMDKTTKDTMSIQVIHKAEEIEKLARSVKERMKG